MIDMLPDSEQLFALEFVKRLVLAWADIHQEELTALWEVMQTGEEYFKIKGLE